MKMERKWSFKGIRKQGIVETETSLSFPSSKLNSGEGHDLSLDSSHKSAGGGSGNGGGKSIRAMWKRFAFKAAKTKATAGDGSLPTSDNSSTQNTSAESQFTDTQHIEKEENDSLTSTDPVYALLRCAATIRKNSSMEDSSGASSVKSKQNMANLDISNSSRSSSPSQGHTNSPTRRRLQLLQQGRGWSADIDENLQEPPTNNQYVILYDFHKRESGDLPLRAGDRVSVKEKTQSGWWLAEFNGEIGYFPARYALLVKPRQTVLQVTQPFHCKIDGTTIHLLKDQVVIQCSADDEQGMVMVETENIQTGAIQRLQCPLAYLRHI